VRPAPLSLRARADLRQATEWIALENQSAARGLRRAVADASIRIAEFPLIGRLRPDLAHARYRFMALTPFPYLLIYNAERTRPVIVRLVHGAGDLPTMLSDL
jgi:toxin ParE1/3/4